MLSVDISIKNYTHISNLLHVKIFAVHTYIEVSVKSNTVFPTSPLELLLLKQLPDHLASRIELLQASSMYVDCM